MYKIVKRKFVGNSIGYFKVVYGLWYIKWHFVHWPQEDYIISPVQCRKTVCLNTHALSILMISSCVNKSSCAPMLLFVIFGHVRILQLSMFSVNIAWMQYVYIYTYCLKNLSYLVKSSTFVLSITVLVYLQSLPESHQKNHNMPTIKVHKENILYCLCLF